MEATIVTANGTAVTVSESENADLFWAIRGGGSNFGVCIEFVLRLHPQRLTVFAGNLAFPAAVLDDMMKVLSEWWEMIKDHEGILQTFSTDPAGNVSGGYLKDSGEQLRTPLQDCIFLFLFYNGSEEEGRKNFQQFYDLSEWATEISMRQYRCGNQLMM
jgi:FAD/FMN-containing dehydrogenase